MGGESNYTECFSPNVLDAHLADLLVRAAAILKGEGFTDSKACQLEVSVQLSSDEAGLRPALHLSKAVIDQLAAVGASVDFDPYCSP